MTFSENLKLRRIRSGLSLADVARACSVSRATAMRWESGEITCPRGDKLSALSHLLCCDNDDLTGITVEQPFGTVEETTFLITGHEMEPRMYPGDRACYLPGAPACDGDYVAVRFRDGQIVCRRITGFRGGIVLHALHPSANPRTVTERELHDGTLTVLGKVVSLEVDLTVSFKR